MDDILLKKIIKIWNGSKRFNQKTFTQSEIDFMQSPPKFIWDYFNGEKVCSCGNELPFISLAKGYKDKCKECSKIEKQKKYKKTMLERYGYEYAFQNDNIQQEVQKQSQKKEIRKKAQQTMKMNGTHQGSETHKNKVRKSKLERYGDEHYTNPNKSKKTKLERYGDEHYSNREKAKNTMKLLYGVESYAKTKEFRDMFSGTNNGTYTHFTNIENFNDDFIRDKFVDGDDFDIVSACEYFNCTYNTFKNKDYYDPHKIGRKVENDFKAIFKDEAEYNNRKIISPMEIDFLFNDYKFGIEYNGLYWHSDKFKDKHYHLNKTKMMELQGYQLFHIFENEWIDKRHIWLSVINSKMNKSSRIYARKCEVKEISNTEADVFCEKNHLQGAASCSIRIGLYYNKELVAVMTFGTPRFNKNYQYELIRYCSKLNKTIVGGASKLLKYFERTHNPNSLVSYANRRWSQGNLYDVLGFEFKYDTPPNYFYFKNGGEILSRYKCQKHKLKDLLELYDETLTEVENMKNNGYHKIYDSGNKIYIKVYNNAKNRNT